MVLILIWRSGFTGRPVGRRVPAVTHQFTGPFVVASILITAYPSSENSFFSFVLSFFFFTKCLYILRIACLRLKKNLLLKEFGRNEIILLLNYTKMFPVKSPLFHMQRLHLKHCLMAYPQWPCDISCHWDTDLEELNPLNFVLDDYKEQNWMDRWI